MKDVKVKLENNSTSDRFLLRIIYYTDSESEISFEIRNATKRLERIDLVIEDINSNKLRPVEISHIIPIKQDIIHVSIKEDKEYTYDIDGLISAMGDKIFLDLFCVSYALEKDEDYYFFINYGERKSEKIKIRF